MIVLTIFYISLKGKLNIKKFNIYDSKNENDFFTNSR